MGDESTTSPWGIYALFVFCTILSISGFVCVGRDTMRAAGLSRFVPPPYMQPSFMNRNRGYRKRGDEESWEEEIDMDVLADEHHDSSVEYDYEFSDDDNNDSDGDSAGAPYVRKPR
ncbi:hypothetical protein BG005_011153 [Podila minutissima]|nr:hypothetical protein BG005_011153 [Podila minutissima]